ncbi:MAG: DUF4192 domain-containing protein [Actinobacteria bacterium]|nr:DUF4192 domain-containing protein [Actinomycetota bacterium]
MTVNDERPILRLRSVDDGLGLIPHLLGFHPEESLVVLVLDGGQVALTARLDLAEAAGPDQVEGVLTRIWCRFPAADAWFVAYTAHRAYAWAVLRRCDRFLPASAARRTIAVDGRTWQADGPRGLRGVYDPGSSRTAAEAAVRGLVARRSRAELAALVDGPPAADTDRLVSVAERVGAELAAEPRWPELMGRALGGFAGTLDDAAAARLAMLASHPVARDVALLSMSRARAEQQVELWRQVVNRTLAVHQGHPLALLGMAAWIAGEGALVSVCLERAGRLLPPAGLLRILRGLVDQVTPPDSWDELQPQLLAAASGEVRQALAVS